MNSEQLEKAVQLAKEFSELYETKGLCAINKRLFADDDYPAVQITAAAFRKLFGVKGKGIVWRSGGKYYDYSINIIVDGVLVYAIMNCNEDDDD